VGRNRYVIGVIDPNHINTMSMNVHNVGPIAFIRSRKFVLRGVGEKKKKKCTVDKEKKLFFFFF
jgi:hypothetical protein